MTQKYADQLGIPFIETSAKDYTNVEDSFLKMAKEVKRNFDNKPVLDAHTDSVRLHESRPVSAKKKKVACWYHRI